MSGCALRWPWFFAGDAAVGGCGRGELLLAGGVVFAGDGSVTGAVAGASVVGFVDSAGGGGGLPTEGGVIFGDGVVATRGGVAAAGVFGSAVAGCPTAGTLDAGVCFFFFGVT